MAHKKYKSFDDFVKELVPTIAIPDMRRIFPELIAHDIVRVQPMNEPTSFAFALRFKYNIQNDLRKKRLEEIKEKYINKDEKDVNKTEE